MSAKTRASFYEQTEALRETILTQLRENLNNAVEVLEQEDKPVDARALAAAQYRLNAETDMKRYLALNKVEFP